MINKYLKSSDKVIEEFKDELFHVNLDEEKLHKLLKLDKFSIDHQDKKGNSFLHQCIIGHKLRSAQWLIDNGANVELTNNNGMSPVMILIEEQNTVFLEIILSKKLININKKDNFGRTLLQNAVVLGFNDVARLLIEYGAEINSKDYNNRNVLFDALSFGDKGFIKYLLGFKELEINYVDSNEESIMHHPQARKDDDNAMELIKAGADVTIKNGEGETFLCSTALRGIEAKDIVEAALEAGNDINARVKNNNSILMELVAASSKVSEIESDRRKSLLGMSQVLVEQGIDINAVDSNNETALFRAVRLEDKEQVSFLLSAGVDPNVMNNQYETVLSISVFKGVASLDIILLLLHNGADPTIKNHKRQTLYEVLNELVLHTHNKKEIKDKDVLEKIDSGGQYLVVLKEILAHNKDPLDFFDTKGDPLFFEPLLEDHFPMFKIYLTNGADIKKKNHDGHNLFYKYVQKVFEDDDPDIEFQNNLSILLSKKVDQNSQDHTGYTVLHKIMHTNCNINLFDTLTEVVLFDYKIGDRLGRSAFHAGVWNDQKVVMKRMYGIDKEAMNIPDIYGILPITYAALLGNQELVLMFLDLKANIKSNVHVAPQAVEKFSPMLKNLQKLKYGLTDATQITHVEMLIDQVMLDFSGKGQQVIVDKR